MDLTAFINSQISNKIQANIILGKNDLNLPQKHFLVQGINLNIQDEQVSFLNIFDCTEIESLNKENIESKYKNLFIRAFQHEIRHPLIGLMEALNQIKNLIDLIQKENQKFEGPLVTFKKKIRMVKKEVSKLLLISLQMQDIFEIQKKQFFLQYNLEDINDCTREAFSLIKGQAKQKKIELMVSIQPNVPKQLIIDKQRIIYVLQHLLVNSVKCSKQGKIELKIKKSNKQQDQNFIEIPYTMYTFTVNDNGSGLTQRQIDNVYDIFDFDLEDNQTQSNGLGLYLAEQIALQLGGRHLKIRSKPNQQTSVKFYVRAILKLELLQKIVAFNENLKKLKSTEIPMRDILSPLSQQESIESFQYEKQESFNVIAKSNSQIQESDFQQECNCKQILVVDDSDFVRQNLIEIFKSRGFITQEARDGQEAIEMVQQKMKNQNCKKFYVITMDCEMPNLNG